MLTSVISNENTHGAWITAQPGPMVCIYNNKQHGQVLGLYKNGQRPNPKAHDIAIAIKDGRATLQVCDGKTIRMVDVPTEQLHYAVIEMLYGLVGQNFSEIDNKPKTVI